MARIGFRLTGTVADIPVLDRLVMFFAPSVLTAPWGCWWRPEERSSFVWPLTTEGVTVDAVRAAGLSPVVVHVDARGIRIVDPSDDRPVAATPTTPPGSSGPGSVREAPSLAEAVRPLEIPGDARVPEALFVVPATGPVATFYFDRLLRLNRDDATVARWVDDDGDKLVLRVSEPPLYLLMRARDRDAEVTAFARLDELGRVWCEWGTTHPLVASLRQRVDPSVVLISKDGRWRTFAEAWTERSIFDALSPSLPLPRIDLETTPDVPRLEIRLRLVPGVPQPPELFFLTPEQLYDLEHLIQDLPHDDLRRLMASRLSGPDSEVYYVLRERAATRGEPLGPRIADFLGAVGFSKHEALDDLYLPVDRRLRPKMRRDELRRMLELDHHRLVIIEDDPHRGPRQIVVEDASEVPLTEWTQLVALDRRLALDALYERAVFAFPPVETVPLADERRTSSGARPPESRPRRAPERPKRRPRPEEPATETAPTADRIDLVAARERAKVLEGELAAGGVDAWSPWAELADLKAALGDAEDAAFAAECAAFYHPWGPAHAEPIDRVLLNRGGALDDDRLVNLAAAGALRPSDAARLMAATLARLVHREPIPPGVIESVLERTLDASFPVSRRQAWLLAAAWYRHADDPLGMTRAQEAAIGILNARGLSELYDVPVFVRRTLAFGQADAVDRADTSERVELERLWDEAVRPLPRDPPTVVYVRLLFGVGLARVGARDALREIVDHVEGAIHGYSAVNQLMFRLLLNRITYESAPTDPDEWSAKVQQTIGSSGSKEQKPARWLAKRCRWLGHPEPEDRPRSLTSNVLRKLEKSPDEGFRATFDALWMPKRGAAPLTEWELVAATEHLVLAAARTGATKTMTALLDGIDEISTSVNVPAHRVRLITASLRGAAAVDAEDRVEAALNELADLAERGELPWIREVKSTLRPALSALRRLGLAERAVDLLEALVNMPTKTPKDRVVLRATLADGFLQLSRFDEADALVRESLDAILSEALGYPDRAEATRVLFDSLRHWPARTRAEFGEEILANMSIFRDSYVMGVHFKPHQIMVTEALVDSLADVQTRKHDLLTAYQDAEEYVIRRKILNDWKELCGA